MLGTNLHVSTENIVLINILLLTLVMLKLIYWLIQKSIVTQTLFQFKTVEYRPLLAAKNASRDIETNMCSRNTLIREALLSSSHVQMCMDQCLPSW